MIATDRLTYLSLTYLDLHSDLAELLQIYVAEALGV